MSSSVGSQVGSCILMRYVDAELVPKAVTVGSGAQVCGVGRAAGVAHEGNTGETGRPEQLQADGGAPGRPAHPPGHLC